MIIGGFGTYCAYKLHYWVERKFKIDDAVGAVAVHGYAGFIGVVVCGFVLWGYPSSPHEGYAAINPLGQFVGAIILFFVLGFLPGWIVAKILAAANVLRIPKQIELLGLDYATNQEEQAAAADVRATEKAAV